MLGVGRALNFCHTLRMKAKQIISVFLLIFSLSANAWWATQHMLVAEVAYQNLNLDVKKRADALIAIHAQQYPKANDFVSAAAWADDIKGTDKRYNHWHYVTLTFENTDDPVPTREDFPSGEHISWAIEHELAILKDNNVSDEEKGLALRRLIHWVGDIHQPLHATTHYSPNYPNGDAGGNGFKLHKDAPMDNLHSLWDSGVDLWFYIPRPLSKQDKRFLFKESKCLQNYYAPVHPGPMDPYKWAIESHELARHYAYTGIDYKGMPSDEYIYQGQELAKQRITEAGLRLADMLNKAL